MPPTRAPLRKKYHVPALHRAFAILDSLNHTSFGLTVQEISHEHKIPYSTAFYLLETMRECGYAERSEDSKKYRLGHKVLSFREGNAGHYLLDLRTIARPTHRSYGTHHPLSDFGARRSGLYRKSRAERLHPAIHVDRWVTSGSSYCSSHDRRIVFGLGAHTLQPAYVAEVRWPNGQTQKASGLTPMRYQVIKERLSAKP
jgi:hypothetical protein